jgi:hypothetical protein
VDRGGEGTSAMGAGAASANPSAIAGDSARRSAASRRVAKADRG